MIEEHHLSRVKKKKIVSVTIGEEEDAICVDASEADIRFFFLSHGENNHFEVD